MKTRLMFLVALAAVMAISPMLQPQERYDGELGKGTNEFSQARGSPGEIGLLKALDDAFAPKSNTCPLGKKADSGGSLKALKDETVDVIMIHGPAAEKKAVEVCIPHPDSFLSPTEKEQSLQHLG